MVPLVRTVNPFSCVFSPFARTSGFSCLDCQSLFFRFGCLVCINNPADYQLGSSSWVFCLYMRFLQNYIPVFFCPPLFCFPFWMVMASYACSSSCLASVRTLCSLCIWPELLPTVSLWQFLRAAFDSPGWSGLSLSMFDLMTSPDADRGWWRVWRVELLWITRPVPFLVMFLRQISWIYYKNGAFVVSVSPVKKAAWGIIVVLHAQNISDSYGHLSNMPQIRFATVDQTRNNDRSLPDISQEIKLSCGRISSSIHPASIYEWKRQKKYWFEKVWYSMN